MAKEISAVSSPLKLRNELHLLRKFWHMSTGLVGLSLHLTLGMEKEETAAILLTLSVLAFIVEFTRVKSKAVNEIVLKFMGPFMRECERNGMSGFPFYALGTSLALFFFSEKIAILAILFLIFSDPISSIFGVLYGKDKILPNKSLQGSLAGFITCYITTLIYLMANGVQEYSLIWFALFSAIIGVLSELISIYLDDNLTIPLLSGFGISILNYFFLYL
jgi:diacylglycerol kinase (CTP)